MRKSNHIHQFRRHTYTTGSQVFFCVHDNCTFKIDTALSLGKNSICWRCGEVFKMDEASIRLAKPHCPKCSRKRIRDEHGQTKYIRPREVADVVSREIATDAAAKLREKLESLVGQVDEDI